MMSGLKKFGWGFMRIVSCIILGVLSVIRWLWRLLVKAVSCYPVVAIIVAVVTCAVVFLVTYTSSRVKIKTAEYQRDSVSYELTKFTQAYEQGDSVFIGNDTITVAK